MVKSRVQYTAPSSGHQFLFEYEVTKHSEANTVRNVDGKIYHLGSSSSVDGGDDGKKRASKRAKSEREEVGYLVGYELRRGCNGNKLFHEHADCVNSELQDFATSLYDRKGEVCRAPSSSSIGDVLWMDGSMFLLYEVEIKHQYSGIDLGINFIHEYLAQPTVAKRVGLVVLKPWNLTSSGMQYEENVQRVNEQMQGKSEGEKVDLNRANTVKLRRQYSRMGFEAVASTSDWVDKWWLNMNKYKTMTPQAVKDAWLSKESAAELDIPMPTREHVNSGKDTELKQLLESLFPDEHDPYAASMNQMRQSVSELQQTLDGVRREISSMIGAALGDAAAGSEIANNAMSGVSRSISSLMPEGGGNTTKLTNEKKASIRRLVNEGASLQGINALHVISAHYKDADLYNLLVDEYGMDIEGYDSVGRRPIHIAAVCGNADAVRILLSKGADKNGRNEEGQTALEEVNQTEQGMDDFTRVLLGGAGGRNAGLAQVRNLLR